MRKGSNYATIKEIMFILYEVNFIGLPRVFFVDIWEKLEYSYI